MVESYLAKDETRAEKVRELFDSIAPRYDLINDLQSFCLHRRWKRRLVQFAEVKPGKRALDLCCGTGDIAFALANKGVKTTAIDFSEPMLKIAEKRKGDADIIYKAGDALNTGEPENHYDCVTIAYGLRNLADFVGGLAEMYRVAKPGGRLCVLDFGKPPSRLIRFWYLGYLKWLVPSFGRIFSKDASAYAYIYESLKDYPAQVGIADAMRKLGCQEIKIDNLMFGTMAINVGVKV